MGTGPFFTLLRHENVFYRVKKGDLTALA
jgi:hypothetical protein